MIYLGVCLSPSYLSFSIQHETQKNEHELLNPQENGVAKHISKKSDTSSDLSFYIYINNNNKKKKYLRIK